MRQISHRMLTISWCVVGVNVEMASKQQMHDGLMSRCAHWSASWITRSMIALERQNASCRCVHVTQNVQLSFKCVSLGERWAWGWIQRTGMETGLRCLIKLEMARSGRTFFAERNEWIVEATKVCLDQLCSNVTKHKACLAFWAAWHSSKAPAPHKCVEQPRT